MTTTNPKVTTARLAVAKNPKSKATALQWYIKDHIGLLHNKATDDLRVELALALAKIKGRNARAIVEICRDCVGNGADGNCRNNVRNCEIKDCLLYNVRPYQSKSKVSLENAMPRAFYRGNASEVIGRLVATKNHSKKGPYNAPQPIILLRIDS
jgi:hypothetical protein